MYTDAYRGDWSRKLTLLRSKTLAAIFVSPSSIPSYTLAYEPWPSTFDESYSTCSFAMMALQKNNSSVYD